MASTFMTHLMKRIIVHLLLLIFSAQVMAAVAREYVIGNPVDTLDYGKQISDIQLPMGKMATVEFNLDAFDETQAICALEEMSDYVTVETTGENSKRYMTLINAKELLFTSINLPRFIPPPRL